jgi:hypothetical protein
MSALRNARAAVRLYVANLALLATHQADAAYWQEWRVFGVPGGLPFFLFFNLVAVALLAAGLVHVAESARHARRFSLLCAATGLVTVGLHAFFLTRDSTAFATPASILVLVSILGISLAQLGALPRGSDTEAR